MWDPGRASRGTDSLLHCGHYGSGGSGGGVEGGGGWGAEGWEPE